MIESARLLLRPWRESDRKPMHQMGRDRQVMAFLGPLLTRKESDAFINRMIELNRRHGYCFWAIERQHDSALIGACGLKPGAPGTPIANKIEIGWRLRSDCWGAGYARESAQAVLDWGWQNLDCESIYAIAAIGNIRSSALMERLGMKRLVDLDFDHPAVPEGSALRRHLTCVAERPE